MAEDIGSLLDEARAAQAPKRGPLCSVARVLLTHPDAAQIAELIGAVKRREILASVAEGILAKHDIALSQSTITRHCRRYCKCDVAA